VPAPAVIPALIAYIKVVAVKKLVVEFKGGKISVKRDQVSHAAEVPGALRGRGGGGFARLLLGTSWLHYLGLHLTHPSHPYHG